MSVLTFSILAERIWLWGLVGSVGVCSKIIQCRNTEILVIFEENRTISRNTENIHARVAHTLHEPLIYAIL